MNRPELLRLLEDAEPGDVILTEQVDRLSRLDDAGWNVAPLQGERHGSAVPMVFMP